MHQMCGFRVGKDREAEPLLSGLKEVGNLTLLVCTLDTCGSSYTIPLSTVCFRSYCSLTIATLKNTDTPIPHANV